MAEDKEIEQAEETPKTKEEMRNEPHEYVDNNGWCAVCGRSIGWEAHPVKEEKAPPVKAQTPAPPDDEAKAEAEPERTTAPLEFTEETESSI